MFELSGMGPVAPEVLLALQHLSRCLELPGLPVPSLAPLTVFTPLSRAGIVAVNEIDSDLACWGARKYEPQFPVGICPGIGRNPTDFLAFQQVREICSLLHLLFAFSPIT